ncbi:DoxX family protein [Streptomyces flaveolus]|uniref:DoxX family protein n=1 Tax=Streptomyces flaveolus TaxID=67297 RepID=UPI0036F82D7D
MFIAYTVIAVLLALAMTFSALAFVSRKPQMVESLQTVGVPENMINVLAALKIAGALGLVVGIFWRPLGIAAAIGLVLYLLGAAVSHLRVKDNKAVGGPLVLALVAAAALVLDVASA